MSEDKGTKTSQPNHVDKAIVNHPYVDDAYYSYHKFMVNLGVVYYCFTKANQLLRVSLIIYIYIKSYDQQPLYTYIIDSIIIDVLDCSCIFQSYSTTTVVCHPFSRGFDANTEKPQAFERQTSPQRWESRPGKTIAWDPVVSSRQYHLMAAA